MIKILFNLLAAMLFTGIAVAQENLAVNGGFEDTEAGTVVDQNSDEAGIRSVDRWMMLAQDGSEATLTVQNLEKYEGENALLVEITTLGTEPYSIQAVYLAVPVEPDEFYRATIRAKSLVSPPGLISFTVGLWAGYPERARIGRDSEPSLLQFNVWKLLTVVFTSELDSARIPIHIHTLGRTYLDDLQVIESALAAAEIDESGDTLVLDFGWDIQEPHADYALTNITLNVDGTQRSIESLNYDQVSMAPWRNILKAKIDSRVGEGATVKVTIKQDETNPLKYKPNPDSNEPDYVPDSQIPRISNEPVDNKSTAVGVRSFAAVPDLIYYVNEGRDLLVVEGLKDGSVIDIYSITGQRLRSRRADNFRETLGIQDLAPGVYVLSVLFTDNARFSAKFLK